MLILWVDTKIGSPICPGAAAIRIRVLHHCIAGNYMRTYALASSARSMVSEIQDEIANSSFASSRQAEDGKLSLQEQVGMASDFPLGG